MLLRVGAGLRVATRLVLEGLRKREGGRRLLMGLRKGARKVVVLRWRQGERMSGRVGVLRLAVVLGSLGMA